MTVMCALFCVIQIAGITDQIALDSHIIWFFISKLTNDAQSFLCPGNAHVNLVWVHDESKSFHNPGFGWLSLYVRLWTGAHSWHDDIFPLTSCGQTNKREKIRNNIGYICRYTETNDIKCKNIYKHSLESMNALLNIYKVKTSST